jgi:hypothetical protein
VQNKDRQPFTAAIKGLRVVRKAVAARFEDDDGNVSACQLACDRDAGWTRRPMTATFGVKCAGLKFLKLSKITLGFSDPTRFVLPPQDSATFEDNGEQRLRSRRELPAGSLNAKQIVNVSLLRCSTARRRPAARALPRVRWSPSRHASATIVVVGLHWPDVVKTDEPPM